MGIHELLLPLTPKPPAPTPSLGARTHHTPAQGSQPHSAFAECSETQIVHSLSTRFLPRAGVGQLIPVTACPQHVPDRLQLGAARSPPGWEASTTPGEPALGTSASTLLFVYQFLANEPFSSTKESYPE